MQAQFSSPVQSEVVRAQAVAVCDICNQSIMSGERFHDDGDEIAHTACVGNWFRTNWGRESL